MRTIVPVTTRSTPASAASAFRSAVRSPDFDAASEDRTTSESRPVSEPVIASGMLNARKSVSPSARRMWNGSTISRVSVGVRLEVPAGASAAPGACAVTCACAS
jgi:hypothetical protein